MKKFFLSLTLGFLPVTALAHTRWFAEGEVTRYQITEPTNLYLGILAIAALLIVAIGIYFERHDILSLSWLQPKAPHAFARAAATFSMVCGAFFLIAGTHYYLFSPNQSVWTGIPALFIYIQIAIGLAFLLGIATRTAALVLLALWTMAIYTTGLVGALENSWVVSTALFIAIMGNDYFSIIGRSFLKNSFIRFQPYALAILRLGTGFTLLVLGFSEKILAPELGLNFLAMHSWNFMQMLGLPYSDYLFVLSAGAVESLFGLIFILGIVTRLNALVVAIFFTIPLFLLGPIELAGHLPHFAAVVMLLLFGGGNLRIFKPIKSLSS